MGVESSLSPLDTTQELNAMPTDTCRILIVEDDVKYARAVAKALRDTRHDLLRDIALSVEITNNAYYVCHELDDACRRKQLRWDIIISDVYMPCPSGGSTAVRRKTIDGDVEWLHEYSAEQLAVPGLEHGAFLIADHIRAFREQEFDIGHLKLIVISSLLEARNDRSRLDPFLEFEGSWFTYYDKADFDNIPRSEHENVVDVFKWALINCINRFKSVFYGGEVWFPQKSGQTLVVDAERIGGQTSIPVALLCGEPGTGKEALARLMHDARNRASAASGPLLAARPTQLPVEYFKCGQSLVAPRRVGVPAPRPLTGAAPELPTSQPTTLFINRVHELLPPQQDELLELIKRVAERSAEDWNPLMGPLPRFIVCATNQRLQDYVDAGSFLEELFHKIVVEVINIPPLRERREDIALYAREALRRQRHGELHFSPEAEDWLTAQDWLPANIRQLREVVSKVCSHCLQTEITADHVQRAYQKYLDEVTPARFGSPPHVSTTGNVTPESLLRGAAKLSDLTSAYPNKKNYAVRVAIVIAAYYSSGMSENDFGDLVGAPDDSIRQFLHQAQMKIQSGDLVAEELMKHVGEEYHAAIQEFCS